MTLKAQFSMNKILMEQDLTVGHESRIALE